MVYQIRFKGFDEVLIKREPFVIAEWPDWLCELAEKTWQRNFAHSPEFYEFVHAADEPTA